MTLRRDAIETLTIGKTGQEQRDRNRYRVTQTPGNALEAKFPLNKTDGGPSRDDRQRNADKTYH